MKFYAHTLKDKPEDEWQSMYDHLSQTGKIMESFTKDDTCQRLAQIAGFLHDFGKYQPAFQKYLKEGGKRGSVPHAVWGAAYAKYLGFNDVSIVIDGHHKGLPDKADWQNDISDFIEGEVPEFKSIIESFHNDTGISESLFEIIKYKYSDAYEYDLRIRILFSLLTDADWLNTEEFCNPETAQKRIYKNLDCNSLINMLDYEISMKSSEGELNKLRNNAREYAVSLAEKPVGFFSMNLPLFLG